MKTKRYTDEEGTVATDGAASASRTRSSRFYGVPVAELCREHGMSNASFYKWRARYGGLDASLTSPMKAREDENRRRKRMYADLTMQADLLKGALGKSNWAVSTPRDGRECRGATWGERLESA